MKIPDYISPIVGYRGWEWDFPTCQTSTSPLRSLTGDTWFPGNPMLAKCVRAVTPWLRAHHTAPRFDCSCGVYAVKSLEAVPEMRYARPWICGEVHLWGTIVEHAFGWRAQFAYPKSFVLPFDIGLLEMNEVLSRVKNLMVYSADILIDDGTNNIAIWTKPSGYDPIGLDYLRSMNISTVAPVAILNADTNGRLLEYGTPADHSVELMFRYIRLPLVEPDSFFSRITLRQAKVVVIDLVPEIRGDMTHIVDVIRRANKEVVVFVRGEIHTPAPRSTSSAPDAYLPRNGRFDIPSTYARVLQNRAKGESDQGKFPLPGAGPSGGPLPPPVAPAYLYRNIIPRRNVAAWPWSE